MTHNELKISKGIDFTIIILYLILVCIGITCIFSVEHKPDDDILGNILKFNTNYAKQILFTCIGLLVGTFILLTDSKFFSAMANLFYAFGIMLMLATFVLGKNVNGSSSWIPLGFMNLQPAELCKIFVALAVAKYLSRSDTDFGNPRSQLIAAAICLSPAILSILQKETGLALVYFSFIFVLFREGLPSVYLISAAFLGVLGVASLVVDTNILTIILTAIAVIAFLLLKRRMRRNRFILLFLVGGLFFSVGTQRYAVPYVLNNVFKCYQSTRILALVGEEYDCSQNKESKLAEADENKKAPRKTDDYNVRQSKMAIGSGGFWGKGFLKGTVTQGSFVPEQHTDFIFTALGESFGFWGSVILAGLYLTLLIVIINVAERQKSAFSRIYAYGVASVIFFHVSINMLMTMGLAPVIGIPLPLMSYGGSSLLTFTIMLFILVRLDADRQLNVR